MEANIRFYRSFNTLIFSIQCQRYDQFRPDVSRRNDYDLSTHSTLPLNGLRRLLRQAETFERRRLRLTTHPPMRFAEIYHAHRARASHHSLVISCVARKKWLSCRGRAISGHGCDSTFRRRCLRQTCMPRSDCKTRRIDNHS